MKPLITADALEDSIEGPQERTRRIEPRRSQRASRRSGGDKVSQYVTMAIGLFLAVSYIWVGFCFLLWAWVISGWVWHTIKEWKDSRQPITNVMPRSGIGTGAKFGTPAELTWTKSRGRGRQNQRGEYDSLINGDSRG